MKFIVAEQELEVPEGIDVDVKARKVTVKGALGTLTRSFKHIPIDIRKETGKKGKASMKFRMWLQKKKTNAVLGTIKSTIRNMMTGVTVGYKFRMVLAYSHFPIVVNVIDNGRVIPFSRRLAKSRTSWDSRPTSASTAPRESSSARRKRTRTTSPLRESTSRTFLRSVPESSNPLSSRTRISALSLTVSTSRMPASS